MKKIAINGFGRIGRAFLRAYLADSRAQQAFEITVINVGSSDIASTAHLFRYDSLMGTFDGTVVMHDHCLVVQGHVIQIVGQLKPADAAWHRFNIDLVVEATGFFTSRIKAMEHIDAGAKKVLITAPSKDADVTIVCGVNDDWFDSFEHNIISLASCTTNALAPMLKVLHEYCRVESAMMNTIHAYTNNQPLLDGYGRDLRQARSAILNMIPTTTGASAAIAQVYPQLTGKITGMSLRVPIAKVSLVDLTFISGQKIDVAGINQAFRLARDQALRFILDTTTEQLVSTDFSLNPHSVIIDESLTTVCGSMGKVFGWYDNEYGYASRIKDFLVKHIA